MMTLRWSTANICRSSMAQGSLDPRNHIRVRKQANGSLESFFFAIYQPGTLSSCFMLRGYWDWNWNRTKNDDVTHRYFSKLLLELVSTMTIYTPLTVGRGDFDVCHCDVKTSATERCTLFCGCRK